MSAADLGRDLRTIVSLNGLESTAIRLIGLLKFGLLGIGALTGCGSDSNPPDESFEGAEAGSPSDTDSEPSPSTSDATTGEPKPDDFEAAFDVMTRRCSECHKAGTGHSFIVGANLDATLQSAVAASSKIQMRVNALDMPTERMPPTTPLSADDLQTLNAWLDSL